MLSVAGKSFTATHDSDFYLALMSVWRIAFRELYMTASKREKVRKALRSRLEQLSSGAETQAEALDESQIEQFCPDIASTRNMLLKCLFTEQRDKGAPGPLPLLCSLPFRAGSLCFTCESSERFSSISST